MTVDYNNRQEIDRLYTHDYLFEGFSYDYYERQISLSCTNSYLKKILNFEFCNVIYYKMQSCLFWAPGYNIYDMYTVELPEEFLKQIDEIKNTKPDWYKMSEVGKGTKYIAVEMVVNSGDALLIVCEKIDISECEYNGD